MSDFDVDLLSQIKRGRQRNYAFKYLSDKPKTVSEIMKLINAEIKKSEEEKPIRLRDISRALKWLEQSGVARCLNPGSRGERGILYELTQKGIKLKSLF